MQIKVFKATTMKEAMAEMKAELGDDAVILHSKKYKEGGLLGLGSKEIVEITAAVEESSLPKREDLPRPNISKPTLFSNSNLSRYKTAGTAQGVEQAEKEIENLSAPPRLNITQTDALTARVAQNKTPTLIKEVEPELPKFDEILNEVEEIQPLEVESQSDAEILNNTAENSVEEKVSEVETPAENSVEEKVSEVETPAENSVEEKVSEVETPVENSVEEKVAEVETPAENAVEEKISEVETPVKNSVEEKVSENVTEKKSEQVANTPEPVQNNQKSEPAMTPEQFAQSQAMMFAQINQMQITQMMQQAMAQVQAQVQAQAQAQAQVAEMAEQMREVHRQRLENSGKSPQTQPTQNIPAVPVNPVIPAVPEVQNNQNDEKIRQLEDEISQMKALLAEVLGRESKKGGISLHEALRKQEVEESILTEMATKSGAGETLADCKSTGARITLSNYLTEHLNFSSGIKLNRHGVRLVALLGTTGVGKTTTLAKIAAKFVLENGVNAALITADTYRISAVDQLKTYSDILGLPLEIVYNPAELNAAIEKHKHKELILIDTAGRSQQNEYQMRELEEFLRVNPRIEKHLVISATTKYTDAQDIMKKFSALEPEKVIITKVDETGSLGMILNLLKDQKIALSYITTGQSVPDDIEQASADILTDFILKKVQA